MIESLFLSFISIDDYLFLAFRFLAAGNFWFWTAETKYDIEKYHNGFWENVILFKKNTTHESLVYFYF